MLMFFSVGFRRCLEELSPVSITLGGGKPCGLEHVALQRVFRDQAGFGLYTSAL